MVEALISVDELARELVTAPPALLDVRWALGGPPGREEFEAGHIPGAQFVDLDAELAAPPGPGRHPLPSAEAFQAAMRSKGVSSSQAVVVYDSNTGLAAARGWWLLRFFGHDRVRMLDGGLKAWSESGHPVELGAAAPAQPGDWVAEPGHLPVLDAAAAAALTQTGLLLDARAPERYSGASEPIDPVAGHTPGARSLPTTGNLDTDGRFRAPEELRARFVAAGAAPGVEVGAYCGSGVTAAHEVLAGSVAGIAVGLYAGSWSEWITDPARAVATGPDPGAATEATLPQR